MPKPLGGDQLRSDVTGSNILAQRFTYIALNFSGQVR